MNLKDIERGQLIKKILSNPAYAPGTPPHLMTMEQLYEKANNPTAYPTSTPPDLNKVKQHLDSVKEELECDCHDCDYCPSPQKDTITIDDGQYSVPTLSGNDQMVIGFVNAKKVYTEYVAKLFDEYLDSLRECDSIHDMNRIRQKLAWIARENDEHDEDDYVHQLELTFNN